MSTSPQLASNAADWAYSVWGLADGPGLPPGTGPTRKSTLPLQDCKCLKARGKWQPEMQLISCAEKFIGESPQILGLCASLTPRPVVLDADDTVPLDRTHELRYVLHIKDQVGRGLYGTDEIEM
jgi:hypothetical protein